jgi:hypothetical protein
MTMLPAPSLRAWDQTEFAGWQVQLVYALPGLLPERAFVQTPPLQ